MMLEKLIAILPEKARLMENENRAFFAKLKKKKPTSLDVVVAGIHDEVFRKIDCLDCANCCKTISPMITFRDVEKMAHALKIKPSKLVEDYLRMDEDGDYVFRSSPCPFLLADNMCLIYEDRPRACREYPHTDRKRFSQILDLTLKNTFVCPAVFEVIEKLKKEFNKRNF